MHLSMITGDTARQGNLAKSDAVSEGAPYTGNRQLVGRIVSVGLLYGHSNGPLGQYHRREVCRCQSPVW